MIMQVRKEKPCLGNAFLIFRRGRKRVIRPPKSEKVGLSIRTSTQLIVVAFAYPLCVGYIRYKYLAQWSWINHVRDTRDIFLFLSSFTSASGLFHLLFSHSLNREKERLGPSSSHDRRGLAMYVAQLRSRYTRFGSGLRSPPTLRRESCETCLTSAAMPSIEIVFSFDGVT